MTIANDESLVRQCKQSHKPEGFREFFANLQEARIIAACLSLLTN